MKRHTLSDGLPLVVACAAAAAARQSKVLSVRRALLQKTTTSSNCCSYSARGSGVPSASPTWAKALVAVAHRSVQHTSDSHIAVQHVTSARIETCKLLLHCISQSRLLTNTKPHIAQRTAHSAQRTAHTWMLQKRSLFTGQPWRWYGLTLVR